MFEEDVVTQMEDLGHDFFVFVNAENERVLAAAQAAPKGRSKASKAAHAEAVRIAAERVAALA